MAKVDAVQVADWLTSDPNLHVSFTSLSSHDCPSAWHVLDAASLQKRPIVFLKLLRLYRCNTPQRCKDGQQRVPHHRQKQDLCWQQSRILGLCGRKANQLKRRFAGGDGRFALAQVQSGGVRSVQRPVEVERLLRRRARGPAESRDFRRSMRPRWPSTRERLPRQSATGQSAALPLPC